MRSLKSVGNGKYIYIDRDSVSQKMFRVSNLNNSRNTEQKDKIRSFLES